MKKNKIILRVLKRTGAIHLLYGFICLFLCISFTIMVIEPNINSFFDSMWYCFNIITTIGLGDTIAVTVAGKILSVVLSIYAILIIAVIPGVLTSYYIESIKLRSNESMEKFMYDLERLPELSKEELIELSKKVKVFHKQRNRHEK